MTDLTVVILTKNEEKNLRKCIESFRSCANRFVIVDSGSTDNTESLCIALKSELKRVGSDLDFYFHEWTTYSDQFNWALNHTAIESEWIMRMDADEELTSELAKEINENLYSISKPVNGIIIKRRVMFMGKWLKHSGRYPEYLLRIFRKGHASCENKMMDEHIVLLDGKTIIFDFDLIDNNQKNLEWWTAKHNWYSNREVLDYQNKQIESDNNKKKLGKKAYIKRFIKERGYYRLPKFFRAHLYYIYRYYIRLGFLDGPEGRIYTFLQAYWYRFLVDAKIYECEKYNIKMDEQRDLKA